MRPTRPRIRGRARRAGSGCRAARRMCGGAPPRDGGGAVAAARKRAVDANQPSSRTLPRRRRRSNCSSCSLQGLVGAEPAVHGGCEPHAGAHAWLRRSAGRAGPAAQTSRQIRAAGSAGARATRDERSAPRTAPASRSPSRSMCVQKSSLRATTISAAADGVGARTSATKSAIVTSTSWPTAEITGTGEAAMARATASSLNAHKSSIDPPPRPTMTTSMPGDRDDVRERAGDIGARRLRPARASGGSPGARSDSGGRAP